MSKVFKSATALIVAAVLSACGGGGGGSASTTTTTQTISGIASAGAPITGATITVLSSNGSYTTLSSPTGSDGAFTFDLDKTQYPGPYLLKITKTSGQSAGSYYAYASADSTNGLLVTPISNATLSLAANADLSSLFESGSFSSLTTSTIGTALDKIFAASSNVFSALSVTDKSKLLSNTSYSANGEGQDAALDAMSISQGEASGSVLIGSKLTGAAQLIDASTATSSISSISSSANGVALVAAIGARIKTANQCIQSAINSSTSTTACMDSSYLNAGMTASDFVSMIRTEAGQITSVGYPSVKWCQFDTITLDLNSTANQLANQSGQCLASYTATATGGAGVINEIYKFTLNSTGVGVSDLKAYGNQIGSGFDIYPSVKKKVRVDSFTTNVGVTSGYAFDIGTALTETNGNPTVTSNSILSAKVEVLDAAQAKTGTGSVLGTFYMQCQQGANCINDNLAVCTSASATCAQGVDTTADNIISVNSGLSTAIITALQQGHVYAKVTAYNKILSDGSKQVKYTKTLPIVGIPVAQSVADQLTFPSLTSGSMNTLRDWAGESTLSLTFDGGDSKFSLMSLEFGAQPSAGITWKSNPITRRNTTVSMTGITGNGSPIISASSTACAARTSEANWRGANIMATYKDVLVNVKYFGSCNSGDY